MDVLAAIPVPDILIEKFPASILRKPLNDPLCSQRVDISVNGADADAPIRTQLRGNFLDRILPAFMLCQKVQKLPALFRMIIFHIRPLNLQIIRKYESIVP